MEFKTNIICNLRQTHFAIWDKYIFQFETNTFAILTNSLKFPSTFWLPDPTFLTSCHHPHHQHKMSGLWTKGQDQVSPESYNHYWYDPYPLPIVIVCESVWWSFMKNLRPQKDDFMWLQVISWLERGSQKKPTWGTFARKWWQSRYCETQNRQLGWKWKWPNGFGKRKMNISWSTSLTNNVEIYKQINMGDICKKITAMKIL